MCIAADWLLVGLREIVSTLCQIVSTVSVLCHFVSNCVRLCQIASNWVDCVKLLLYVLPVCLAKVDELYTRHMQ